MIIELSWHDESPEMLGEMAQTEGDFDKMAIDYITEAGIGNWGSWCSWGRHPGNADFLTSTVQFWATSIS